MAIDALKQKLISKDLEEEISNYFNGWSNDSEYKQAVMPDYSCVSVEDCQNIARHFANWQKQ